MTSQMKFHESRSLIGNMIRTVVTLKRGSCIAFARDDSWLGKAKMYDYSSSHSR